MNHKLVTLLAPCGSSTVASAIELTDFTDVSTAYSDKSLLQLGAIIGKQDEYRAVGGADEYRGTGHTDMEKIVIASGVLIGESLSALANGKLDDVHFAEPVSVPRHGWLVRAGAGFQSSDFSGLTDNDPKLTIQLEYAKPYGLQG